MKLLAFFDIDETITWEDTLRKIITHELYKSLETLAEKKDAFAKYQRKIVDDRLAAKAERVEKLRPALLALFASTREIKSWSTAKTANRVFRGNRMWESAKEDEREAILDGYTRDMLLKEETEARETRARNLESLNALIRTLDITVSTRWRQAHDLVVSSSAFKADADLEKVDTVDILDVYDNYARELEKEHEEESRKFRISKVREARKARDGFKELLSELRDKGEMTGRSKWMDLYPRIRDDERYLALLGKTGSNPLELWMDAVDDLEEETERAAEKINKGLAGTEKKVEAETSWEEFEAWVKEAHLETMIDVKLRKEVHAMVRPLLLLLMVTLTCRSLPSSSKPQRMRSAARSGNDDTGLMTSATL
jgi:pre-mRNA-processing factor 40